VVPAAQQNANSGIAAVYPFDLGQIRPAPMRYQQVYLASEFVNAAPAAAISEIAFRPDSEHGAAFAPTTAQNVKVVLSTTAASPGALSMVFAANTGDDAATVFEGPLVLSSSYAGPSGHPKAFDVRIHLTTPFPYDPSKGNLLLDVTISSQTATSPLSAANDHGDSVSRIYALDGSAGVATAADNKGLVTQFTFGSFALPPKCGPAPKKTAWLISASALSMINNIDSSLGENFFDNACTYVIGSPIPAGWSSIPTTGFRSFADFSTAITNGTIDTITRAVLYDNESWSFTPPIEQTNPALYMVLFGNLAHAYGYAFVGTPALDLVPLQPGYVSGTPSWEQYLSMQFPAAVAQADADLYNIQAQSLEPAIGANPGSSTYVSLVKGAVSQARIVNSGTSAFAGISTAPAGHIVTADQIYEAMVRTEKAVSGYWLNIPGPGPTCPTCIPPDPQLLVDALRRLAR
jgi:hypothetical protein